MTYNVGAVIALTLYGKAFYAMSKFFDLLMKLGYLSETDK